MELKEIDAALSTAHASLEIQNCRGDVHGQALRPPSPSASRTTSTTARRGRFRGWSAPCRCAGNLFRRVATLNNFGLMYRELGRSEAAMTTYRELIPVASEAGLPLRAGDRLAQPR
jgi:hypothetical protein